MFKSIIIIFGIISFISADDQLYKNAKLIKVKNISEKLKCNIANDFELRFGCKIWRETNTEIDIVLQVNQIHDVKNYMKQNSLTFDVLIDNLQDEIDKEKGTDHIETRGFFDNKTMDWADYHDTETILKFLDDMKQQYPELVNVVDIGKSHEGRPLKVLAISEAYTKKKIWLDGGIHAREWISPAVATFIANALLSNWNILPKHITSKTWYIMPLINPDGYEYSRNHDRIWRKNRKKDSATQCYGVDLNRNWDIDWNNPRQARSINPCSDIYRGSAPFSESETSSVAKFIKENSNNLEAFLTFHSFGQYILYPWGFSQDKAPEAEKMKDAATMASNKIKEITGAIYKVQQSNILGLISGGSDDWAKNYFKLPYAYTIELRPIASNDVKGFTLPKEQIINVGAEGLIIADSIARAISKDEEESTGWAWGAK